MSHLSGADVIVHRILHPTYTTDGQPGFPIQVDKQAQTVQVAAGVPQRILLDYLANFL